MPLMDDEWAEIRQSAEDAIRRGLFTIFDLENILDDAVQDACVEAASKLSEFAPSELDVPEKRSEILAVLKRAVRFRAPKRALDALRKQKKLERQHEAWARGVAVATVKVETPARRKMQLSALAATQNTLAVLDGEVTHSPEETPAEVRDRNAAFDFAWALATGEVRKWRPYMDPAKDLAILDQILRGTGTAGWMLRLYDVSDEIKKIQWQIECEHRPLDEVAAEFGHSVAHVENLLKRGRAGTYVVLLSSGLTIAEIAAGLDVSERAVRDGLDAAKEILAELLYECRGRRHADHEDKYAWTDNEVGIQLWLDEHPAEMPPAEVPAAAGDLFLAAARGEVVDVAELTEKQREDLDVNAARRKELDERKP